MEFRFTCEVFEASMRFDFALVWIDPYLLIENIDKGLWVYQMVINF